MDPTGAWLGQSALQCPECPCVGSTRFRDSATVNAQASLGAMWSPSPGGAPAPPQPPSRHLHTLRPPSSQGGLRQHRWGHRAPGPGHPPPSHLPPPRRRLPGSIRTFLPELYSKARITAPQDTFLPSISRMPLFITCLQMARLLRFLEPCLLEGLWPF